MTALSVGASLTWYHSRYPTFDGAKVLLFLQNMGSVSDLMFLNKFTTRARVENTIKVHTALPFF